MTNLTSTPAITCSNKAVKTDPFTGALCASDCEECYLYQGFGWSLSWQ